MRFSAAATGRELSRGDREKRVTAENTAAVEGDRPLAVVGYRSQMSMKFSNTSSPSAVWATSGCHWTP
ncbi:hypothetical protein BN996_02355 [Haloferax massiliensis]|uniref:Uncharacterized protein n=1 Tax=Haloferax massiliensis TaxID=1476858 RepID=A0A0D6JSI9_9EURY|nr:hypothetical protein BN996_02355 [Haloferax massiliensis]